MIIENIDYLFTADEALFNDWHRLGDKLRAIARQVDDLAGVAQNSTPATKERVAEYLEGARQFGWGHHDQFKAFSTEFSALALRTQLYIDRARVLHTPTIVVNLARGQKADVYVGRAESWDPRAFPNEGASGKFGNPVVPGSSCAYCCQSHADKDSTIDCFRLYFQGRIATDILFALAVEQLRGKRLGCFCKGPGQPGRCHGDVYVEHLETTRRPDRDVLGEMADRLAP